MTTSLNNFDQKQCSLIRSWMAQALAVNNDHYGKFIYQWIAFNAFCYGCYASEANRLRADLKKDKGLANIGNGSIETRGSIRSVGDKIRIELSEPGQITLDLVERYTEDLIFSAFAKAYQSEYGQWLADPEFNKAVVNFKQALFKGHDGKHYIINMARIEDYQRIHNDKLNTDILGPPIVYPFEDIHNLFDLKNVLYQARCNIFHGEKVPDCLNDDRIVKAANPVLSRIMDSVTANLPKEM